MGHGKFKTFGRTQFAKLQVLPGFDFLESEKSPKKVLKSTFIVSTLLAGSNYF